MTDTRALTADDVRAIRQGDGFVVTLDGVNAELRITKKLPRKVGPFSHDEYAETRVERRILCNVRTTPQASFCDLYRPPAYVALGLIVRVGDRLVFDARRNNNAYCTDAGLSYQELTVTVQRPDTKGRERTVVHEWPLSHTLTPNNSAQAIRPSDYRIRIDEQSFDPAAQR